jgi:hypothetical protein
VLHGRGDQNHAAPDRLTVDRRSHRQRGAPVEEIGEQVDGAEVHLTVEDDHDIGISTGQVQGQPGLATQDTPPRREIGSAAERDV